MQETLGLGESASRPPPPKTLRALGTRPVGLRLSLPNGSDTVANSVMVQRFLGKIWKDDGQWRFKTILHFAIFCTIYDIYIIDTVQ